VSAVLGVIVFLRTGSGVFVVPAMHIFIFHFVNPMLDFSPYYVT
jgi:hypothetical protein